MQHSSLSQVHVCNEEDALDVLWYGSPVAAFSSERVICKPDVTCQIAKLQFLSDSEVAIFDPFVPAFGCV